MPFAMPHSETEPREENPRLRRRLVLGAVAVVVLLALIITPPLISVERLRHRIATSMSQSLGRPVHMDRVSVHLFPMPGFTLGNLVVSEDPAFGYEPVIRAETVEATLRPSSLWRRKVEFSTIKFVEPSVNIVRNAQGRWNLEDILMQAARVETAPTAQAKAGPAPRFPYIEATNARVNLKLGDEKMPFSLTEADFALWLPSPQRWRVRIQGKPARTDTNASDTGVVRLEGTLGHAHTLADVALDLTASWAHAQMGEATKLLTGDDAGWRGTVDAGATLSGRVGAAAVTADVHLTDLRRADFVPAKLLDVSAHCTAGVDVTVVTLTQAVCTIPAGGALPITVSAAAVDLQHPREAAATIALNKMPFPWALDWARVFSQHVPAELKPVGDLDGTLAWSAGGWTGDLTSTLVSANTADLEYDFTTNPIVANWAVVATGSRFQFVTSQAGNPAPVRLTVALEPSQVVVGFTGKATLGEMISTGNAVFPPLGDKAAEPYQDAAAEEAAPVDFSCTIPINGDQTCSANRAAVVTKVRRKR